MPRDIEILRLYIRIVIIFTAICTNAVPILYVFSPWHKTVLGKLFMLQATTLAAAINFRLFLTFWPISNIRILFWISAGIFTSLSVATGSLAVFIWRMNFHKKKVIRLLLSDQVYQVLKKIVQIGLPGLATLYFTLATIWDLPNAEQVVGTIAALTTFLGLILGMSTKTYNESEAKYGGTLAVEDGEEGSTLRLKQLDPAYILDRDEITFKIDKT